MIADVVIDRKTKVLDIAYSYCVPSELDVEVGCAVLVDFHERTSVGFVVSLHEGDPSDKKDILEVLSEPYFDTTMANLLLWIAHNYISPLSTAIRMAIPPGGTPRVVQHQDGATSVVKPLRRPKKQSFYAKEVAAASKAYERPSTLTTEQNLALGAINCAAPNSVILVDGVTGSGKTEVYLQAIEKVIARGKTAIVLVPEISLTPQTVARFESRFPGEVAVMHSKMTQGERRAQWFWIAEGNAKVVVGPRSALFSPLKNVGIIVIDEEHESSYKQESAPRYHAREVAREFVRLSGGVLVLGDATPSIDALYLAKHEPNWQRVVLSRRATGAKMPCVEVVDMTKLEKGGRFILFSQHLQTAILDELKACHKVVLLLNRRGFAHNLQCRECGFVPECPNCSTSLTFHEAGNLLKCHHCDYKVQSPPRCPACGSPLLGRIGVGTQRVEAELRMLLTDEFDDVAVVRMDADTTSQAHSHEQLLQEFGDAKRAVLLGTQMIAKGLDFEEVTLVGVLNADTTMHVPDFRAAEKTFCLIEQVSGRCGRASLPGKVIVQTFEPDNCAIRAAQTHDREMFLRVELPKRSVLKFPPYCQMINVLVWSSNVNLAQAEIEAIHGELCELLAGHDVNISPAMPCPFEKLQKSWRFHIVLKAPNSNKIAPLLESHFRKRKQNTFVNVAVDVDPISVL